MSDNPTPGLAFASGVYVGQRGDPGDFAGWFGGSPVSQFAGFTIANVQNERLGAAYGLIGKRKPTTLRLDGTGVARFVDQLYAIEADVVREPTNTQSGFRTAVARRGFLTQISVRLKDNVARTEWGIVTNVDVRLDQGPYNWRCDFVFNPVDLLWWDPLDTLFARTLPTPPMEES